MSRWAVLIGTLLLLLLSLSRPLLAQPATSPADIEAGRERAKAHFDRGRKAFEEGRYKDAVDAFLDAHNEVPSPDLSFNAALAYEKLGDTAGALRFFREYLRQKPDAPDREKVGVRVGELEDKLRARGVQQVTVLSEPGGATVYIDKNPVGVTPWTGEIVPGRHALRLTREGFGDNTGSFVLPTHRAIDVSVKLSPALEHPVTPPAPKPSAPKHEPGPERSRGVGLWTWTAFGVGAAALGGALTFELLRRSSADDVKTERTRVDRLEANDQMESRQKTARILAGVGAVAVLTGGVLLYFDLSGGSSEKQKATGSRLSLGCASASCGATLGGSF